MSATSEQLAEELRLLEEKIGDRVKRGEPVHHEDRVRLNELRMKLQTSVTLTEGKSLLKG